MPNPKPLKDTDPMPFGSHKGKRMQDVPAQYLDYVSGQELEDPKSYGTADDEDD